LNTILNFGKVKKAAPTPITPTGSAVKPYTSSATNRTAKADCAKGGTGDATRDKCVELVYDALVSDTTSRMFYAFTSFKLTTYFWLAIERVLSISRAVEKSVLELMGGTTAEYKSKIRSLFVNLKDKANPALRASLVDGSLAPEKFARMTSQVKFPFF
jgi:transcription elongation factor S-II